MKNVPITDILDQNKNKRNGKKTSHDTLPFNSTLMKSNEITAEAQVEHCSIFKKASLTIRWQNMQHKFVNSKE